MSDMSTILGFLKKMSAHDAKANVIAAGRIFNKTNEH